MNPSVRSESNPPVFGEERDRVKALAALEYHERALEAATAAMASVRAKRARFIARLDEQVVEAKCALIRARDEYEAAVGRAAPFKET